MTPNLYPPKDGTHVKCLLRNNTVAEGIVEEWYNNYVKLKSIDGKSYLIIHHPNEDIVLTKVVVEEIPEDSPEPDPTPTPKSQAALITEKIHLRRAKPRDSGADEQTLDAMTKAELQVELAKQEREIIANKLRDHNLTDVKKVKYGYPGFFKKPRTQ